MTEPSHLQKLGKYQVLEELGQRSFATVYRARDPDLERDIALKVLHPILLTDAAFVERFRREARAIARLNHPHIVTVYEIGETDGRLFIAMELVDGPSLQQRIAQRGRLPWAEALALLAEMAEALEYAHSQGVLHRDLKPSNVLLHPRKGVLLTDFGLAGWVGESAPCDSLGRSGGLMGTPPYIAPEVWEGQQATTWSDVYALACVTYEMLTGEVLFGGSTPLVVLRRVLEGPRFPQAWPAGVPTELEEELRKALAPEPVTRFRDPSSFLLALQGLGQPAAVSRGTVTQEPRTREPRAVGTRIPAPGRPFWLNVLWGVEGLIVGLFLGITALAPKWTNGNSYDLAPEAKAEYVSLVTDSCRIDRDYAAAARLLELWTPEEKQMAFADAIEAAEAYGRPDRAQAISDLALVLGISTEPLPAAPPPSASGRSVGLILVLVLPTSLFVVIAGFELRAIVRKRRAR